MIDDIIAFTTPAWGITASIYQLDTRARRRVVAGIDVSFSSFLTILIYAMYATTASLRIAESFNRQFDRCYSSRQRYDGVLFYK